MDGVRRGDLPLSDYALVGDGRTAALIARDGAVDWMCYGRFDGPAVFCRLLDCEKGGYFQVSPRGAFEATRRYVGRSNVLETEIECATGRIRRTDFMPLATGAKPMLLRRVDGLSGNVRLHVAFVPTFDFARARTVVEKDPDGSVARAAGQVLRLSCPATMTASDGGATGSFELRGGETRWLVLAHDAPALDDAAAQRALESTLESWERWSAHGTYPAPYEDVLRRSALALKLLIHAPTGAMVAAPTTSLPEVLGGLRNWDYRFTWLRDASWVVSALMDLGYHDESMAFIQWLQSLDLGTEAASVLYAVDGRSPSEETELHHLRGYARSRPVRVGNAAVTQDQHDVFGEVVSAVHMCSEAMRSMRPLEPALWKLVSALADKAVEHWQHADHGMWEVRDGPHHFVSSKLLCWTALDRALSIARRDRLSGPVARWEAERERIRRTILEAGFDEDLGAFRRAFDAPGLDATSLLISHYGLLPADEPRVARSVQTVRTRLSSCGLLRRYLARDGLHGVEGLFTACSFWLADCLARQGRIDDARAVFERVVAYANDLGLLSEEIATESGELLGNFPQAFTHLALIRAAVAISQAEQRNA